MEVLLQGAKAVMLEVDGGGGPGPASNRSLLFQKVVAWSPREGLEALEEMLLFLLLGWAVLLRGGQRSCRDRRRGRGHRRKRGGAAPAGGQWAGLLQVVGGAPALQESQPGRHFFQASLPIPVLGEWLVEVESYLEFHRDQRPLDREPCRGGSRWD
ncbi:hypothetical protein NDU88_000747 [Pleurodeles waltl]|uniref:Uncharacterized protein n=1 Tax=Pleurodeles waltl TaxID=8319 RepID=A0AAV7KMU6_PLEWA|nr:hypothetical protein NDU88_000747 [Pleurodeles waltl]